jgi:parallel beta-helix repeat protein
MRGLVTAILVISVLAMFTAVASADQTTKIYPSYDSYIDRENPNTAYGTSSYLILGAFVNSGQERRDLVQFDLSSISGRTVTDATLHMYRWQKYRTGSLDADVHRVTQSWVESSATWNKYDGTHNWASAGGDFDATVIASTTLAGEPTGYPCGSSICSDTTWYQWDVTSLVQDWEEGTHPNNGLMVKTNDFSHTMSYFRTKNYGDSDYWPYLEVTTTCGDICVNTTGWWRAGAAFNASNTPIQHAINNAIAGNTICVKNGTYNENVDVGTRLTIRSENGSASTTVQAQSAGDHIFNVSVDYVNISGFTATGATGGGKAGIYLNNGVSNCNISDNNASYNFFGIYLPYSSNNNTLANNTANSNTQYGILLESSCNNNTLTGNTANLNTQHGIVVEGWSNNNTLTSNTANSNTQYGIYLWYSGNNNTLTNNTANLNSNHGIVLEGSSDNNITCNWVAHNEQRGFYLLGGSTGNNISYNNIMSNGVAASGSWHYNFYNGQDDAVTATNNYWGTANSAVIAESIYTTGGTVTYVPFLNDPDPCAPIPELATIIAILPGLVVLAGYVWIRKRR